MNLIIWWRKHNLHCGKIHGALSTHYRSILLSLRLKEGLREEVRFLLFKKTLFIFRARGTKGEKRERNTDVREKH